MKENYNINIGAKYYKYIKDENDNSVLSILRLYKIKNVNKFVMVDKDFNKINLSKKEFDTYIKLLPDGYINIRLVTVLGKEDVIISLLRTEDVLESGSGEPFVVCRQQISDIFANALYTQNIKVGLSINRNNCPNGVNMVDFAVSDEILSTYVVSVYLDDSLEDILKFIPKSKYDAALYRLNNEVKFDGAVNRLSDLLVSNDFYNDFMAAFNINKMNVKLSEEYTDFVNIQKATNIKMINPIILKYSDDIDLQKITRDYMLLSDIDNDIYVLCYSNGGLLRNIESLKQ